MAKEVVQGTVLEGDISARVYIDGSLSLELRYRGSNGFYEFQKQIVLSHKGADVLRELLDRAVEQRDEAERAGAVENASIVGAEEWDDQAGDDDL